MSLVEAGTQLYEIGVVALTGPATAVKVTTSPALITFWAEIDFSVIGTHGVGVLDIVTG